MHRPEFIQLIDDVASDLGIKTSHFADNWAISLSKGSTTKFIVGYALPLNNSVCLKIAQSKDLCSEILTLNNIPNVPHEVLLCPSVLKRRKIENGNYKIIQDYIAKNGFPFLVKKNNSSKGSGVYFINNERELEDILSKIYTTESTLCLSPFRENIREYRNVVLDGECLISYEKQIPFILGDGENSIIELLSQFAKKNDKISSKSVQFFDNSLLTKLTTVPDQNEKVFLQWKHNRFPGTKYELVDNTAMKELAIKAAKAIDARFVSVDIIQSDKFGLEILEINASVGIHFPLHSANKSGFSDKEIFKLALKKVFS